MTLNEDTDKSPFGGEDLVNVNFMVTTYKVNHNNWYKKKSKKNSNYVFEI